LTARRHRPRGFGVPAASASISLNLVQKWLGDTQLTTTAIYCDAVGADEKGHRLLNVGVSRQQNRPKPLLPSWEQV
jgi:hypothetical protein